MQIAKWGNSLAVRLPKAVIDAMGLKEGDDVQIVASDKQTLTIKRDLTREEALTLMRKLRRPLPPGYKFDRQEANER